MRKWIETSGKNEDAAIAVALQKLGLDRDEVSVEVLERAKSGFLGIGAAPARVKVSYEAPDEPSPVVPPAPAPAPVKKAEPPAPKPVAAPIPKPVAPAPKLREEKVVPTFNREAPVETAAPAPTPAAPKPPAAKPFGERPAKGVPAVQDDELEEKIATFLTGLLTHMDLCAVVKSAPRAEGGYQVLLEGEHLGALIGHRGETLDAISQLCNYAVNRDRQKRVRIHIDVENYRQKREESLRHLAEKVAAKVVKYRRNITLEPMNAYERHVIHETLQELPDVLTYSTGTEPNRRTVVAYSRGKHSY